MRKWQRERGQRRRKSAEANTKEPQPAPLQPSFYDAPSEQAPSSEDMGPQEARGEEAADAEINYNREDANVSRDLMSGAEGGSGRFRRGRRGRGGRGRRRSPQGGKTAAAGTSARPTKQAGPVAVAEEPPSAPALPAPAPVALEAPAPVPSKGTVVLAIGLPGSGKSSWFKRHNIVPLSSDMLRSILFDDPTEQRFQDLVFSNLRSMLRARLIAKRPLNYVDTTNLTPHERQNWVKLAKDYGYEIQAVYFDVPLEVCLERNQRRERVVPEDVMRRMAAKLKAPTFEEGFSKVTVVRVKPKSQSEPQIEALSS